VDAIARIRARNGAVRAFLYTRLDEARGDYDARMRESPRSGLHGMPYSLKDMWDTADIPTTGGSYRFRDRTPSESSPVHTLFDAAGAVLLGKTSLSDLAIVPEASNYFVGRTSNPHDSTRTSGGSSGGAAAAVADGMVAFDWGSDFGGSIRLPSAYCGVYGVRLSTEAWPVRGMFPMLPPSVGWMNGQGPITGSVGLMETVLKVAAHTLRTGSATRFEPRGVMLYAPDRGTSGQWPTFADDVRPGLRRSLEEVREDHGLPSPSQARLFGPEMVASHFDDLMAADDSISFREGARAVLSSIVLRGMTGDRRFHPQTAAMLALIALGRYTIYSNRERALAKVNRFRDQIRELWHRGYVVAMPTVTFPAPRHGTTMFNPQLISFSMLGNISDATALAIPFGHYAGGLPRSMQLLGPPGSEFELLRVAERMAT